MAVEPDFVELLGLGQSLTPSRTNGFMNMLRLMQKKSLECYMEAEKAAKDA
jgi:sulfur transfer protein SufE